MLASLWLFGLFGAFYQWLIGETFAGILLAVLAVVLGVVFFALRERQRSLYGYFEICLALVTIPGLSENLFPKPDSGNLLRWVTGIYLLIRGLDNNLDKGAPILILYTLLRKRPEDKAHSTSTGQ
jgi:hypothetical protein